MATPFYKNDNGGYVFGDGLLAVTAPKRIEHDGDIVKLSYNNSVIYWGNVNELTKEDTLPYLDYAELIAGVGDFFDNAPSTSSRFVFATLGATNWGNSDMVELFGGNVIAPPNQTRLLLSGDYSDFTSHTADQFHIVVGGSTYIGESVETIGSDFIVHFNNSDWDLILNASSLSFRNNTISAATITKFTEMGSGLREYEIVDENITNDTWITFIVRGSGVAFARAAKVQRNGTFESGKMKVYASFVPTGDIEVFYHIQNSKNVSGINDFYVQNMDYTYTEIDNLINP